MLVAQEGIWLSEKTTDFKKNSYYTWEQMQEDDLFLQVYKVCGNVRCSRIIPCCFVSIMVNAGDST